MINLQIKFNSATSRDLSQDFRFQIVLKDHLVKEILRLKSFDLLIQQEKKEVSKEIGVITLDEKAIEKYGQWPWKRDVLANLIIKLRENSF